MSPGVLPTAAVQARQPARQQRVALARVSAGHTPLEQLEHHPEREARLKLRAPRAQHFVSQASCAAERCLEQRRLPDARPALDEDYAATLRQLLHRRQLALSFQQPFHVRTLGRACCARPAGGTCTPSVDQQARGAPDRVLLNA